MKEGDRVLLFDGRNHSFLATLIKASASAASLTLDESIDERTESALALHLGLGLSKGDRMDVAIQKAVEIGVKQITPLMTEFSVIRLDPKRQLKKLEHWHGIIVHACEQSGRSEVPVLNPITTLTDWVNHDSELKLIFTPEANCTLAQLDKATQVSILIGPEGGLSESEVVQATQHGFTAVRLGPRTLRTETAAIAISSALQTLWGDYN